jgi:heme O synthase-like polyprenyltransferase
MTDYSSLSAEPKQFHALTGHTVAEFEALLPAFAERLQAQMQVYTLVIDPTKRRAYRLFHASNFYLLIILVAVVVGTLVKMP